MNPSEGKTTGRFSARGLSRTLPAVIPVAAEILRVGRRRVATGRVHVRKVVRDRFVTVDEPLRRDDVVVERVPVNRIIDGPVAPRQEGDTLVLPVVEEVLVTQLRLVEEVRVRMRRSARRHRRQVRLRREEVRIERRPMAAAPGSTHGAAQD
jgi:uncharacterized protein (TIGR02271 family)